MDFDTEDEEGQDTGVDLEIPAEGVDEEDNENEVDGEDGGDEDAVVIEAASCGELLQACKGKYIIMIILQCYIDDN